MSETLHIDSLKIGDALKEYIYTVIGECVGCIEMEVAQNLEGEKICVVTNSHGGVGFISNGATKVLKPSRYIHRDARCTVPDDEKRGPHVCGSCWMNQPPAP